MDNSTITMAASGLKLKSKMTDLFLVLHGFLKGIFSFVATMEF
jgi:hypothetical protein